MKSPCANILVIFLVFTFTAQIFGQNNYTVKPYKVVQVEDYFAGVPLDGKYESLIPGKYTYISNIQPNLFNTPFTKEITGADFYGSVQFIPVGGTTIFDQQSNACPVQVWQDPANPQYIHVVHMTSPMEDTFPAFPLRRTKYYFSSNYGSSWEFRAELPVNIRSGYGVIDGLSDGSVLIANHFISGPSVSRTFIHREVFPQLGSFDRMDPGLGSTGQVEWPRMISGNDINGPVKFVVLSSGNDNDSAFSNYCTGFINNGQFGQWKFFRSRNAECYAIAKSGSGKIGVAYINNETRFPADIGDVFFLESTNMGQTFSSPLKIFDADLSSPSADSMGALRGISMVYTNNQPRVIFETAFQEIGFGFYPGIASNIRYWTPSLPGANPDKSIIIVDSLDVPFYPHQGVNDVLTGICRPVIGKSSDGFALFAAFMVADSVLGGSHDPTSFHNIYLTASVNNGFNWKSPVKITPSSPRKDWTYVSISTTSDQNPSKYFVNLVMQSDDIPGSYPAGPANGKSLAQQIFARVSIDKPLLVTPISTGIPYDISLYQNYPNPFNPETKIRFSIPESSIVTLNVFDINGRLVKTLIQDEKLPAGIYETSFNAGELSSGIFFYKINVEGKYFKTRKMVLLK